MYNVKNLTYMGLEYSNWKNADINHQEGLKNLKKEKAKAEKLFLKKMRKTVKLIRKRFPSIELYDNGVHTITEEGGFLKASASGYGWSELFIPIRYAYLSEEETIQSLKNEKRPFRFVYNPG